MSLPADLLELAEKLARLERRRPKQVSLRRSISTAYYALFHLLTSETVAILGPNIQPASASRMQRWFEHAEMKRISAFFATAAPPRPFLMLLITPPSADLQQVALNFVLLQQARHEADYDLGIQIDRGAVLDHLQSAWDAFDAWNRIRRTHEANIFALALLSPKLFERER